MACAIAWLTCAGVAPAASRAARTALALVMRLPTTPTTTLVTVWLSGVPSPPRIAARDGHARVSPIVSPARSTGLIVSGDQAIRQAPLRSTRCTVVTGFQAPAFGRLKCSVTRMLTAFPEGAVRVRPAVKVACVTSRPANTAALTDAKSAGGRATWRRIAAQSPLPQAPR